MVDEFDVEPEVEAVIAQLFVEMERDQADSNLPVGMSASSLARLRRRRRLQVDVSLLPTIQWDAQEMLHQELVDREGNQDPIPSWVAQETARHEPTDREDNQHPSTSWDSTETARLEPTDREDGLTLEAMRLHIVQELERGHNEWERKFLMPYIGTP